MYKVFVNDFPIILSTKKDMGENYISLPLKMTKIKRVIRKVGQGKLKNVNLYHKNENKLLPIFFKKIKVVRAAGGLVKNSRDEVLFIFRNGKWDLPKGKIEAGENLEECAIREVEEETGIQDLEVVRYLETTYHIFNRRGRMKLKETVWYEMRSDYQGPFTPQEDEDITKVKWKGGEKLQKALKKSYANIQLLFSEEHTSIKSKDRISQM